MRHKSRRGGTSSKIVDRPPVLSNEPANISRLIRCFLGNCLKHHPCCTLDKRPLGEGTLQKQKVFLQQGSILEDFELPTRVLAIHDIGGTSTVKLLETRGSRGTYCALSHCWGSEDKRPLETTRRNLQDHLADIPWSSLPTTFRDAIDLTKGLGITYLWIDSLCIIQDDDSDWNSEAKKMASVYQRAALVIAATDAKDSSEGLFIAKRPDPQVFRLPILMSEGCRQNILIAEAPADSLEDGIGGPLRTRAWAFQEWYLARRIAFFTSKGIKWKCQEQETNERGNEVDLNMSEALSWNACLEIYSGKQLTFPSDRIPALLGIVAELRGERSAPFREDFGIWEDELAEQLLWRQTEEPQGKCDLPSWSWAAAGGAKRWIFKYPMDFNLKPKVCDTPQTIKLTPTQSLSASGYLITVTTKPEQLEQCCIKNLRGVFSDVQREMLPSSGTFDSNTARLPLFGKRDYYPFKRDIIGFAVFDNEQMYSDCLCFILGATYEKSRDS